MRDAGNAGGIALAETDSRHVGNPPRPPSCPGPGSSLAEGELGTGLTAMHPGRGGTACRVQCVVLLLVLPGAALRVMRRWSG